MNLASIRDLESIKPVLMLEKDHGPDPVYWVFSNISKDRWVNLTVIAPGFFSPDLVPTSGEYPKTFGHYHGVQINETYHLVEGKGVLLLQKKHYDQNKNWIQNMVDEVILITAEPGDEIIIKPEWGHSWSNIGSTPLLSFDTWHEGHNPQDYAPIEKVQGMAYYLVAEHGQIKVVPNSNYQNLPQPSWMTAAQFKVRQSL
jgi:oxalate decarboxylase/phosphoglucose isomerase-like protein (cupin superfamily)